MENITEYLEMFVAYLKTLFAAIYDFVTAVD